MTAMNELGEQRTILVRPPWRPWFHFLVGAALSVPFALADMDTAGAVICWSWLIGSYFIRAGGVRVPVGQLQGGVSGVGQQ